MHGTCGISYCRQKKPSIFKYLPQLGIPKKYAVIEVQTFYPEVFMNLFPIQTLILNFATHITIPQTLQKELSEQLKIS